MIKRRHIRQYLTYLEKMSVEVESVGVTGSTHIKIGVTSKGNHRNFTLPSTPSDHRSFLNWKCDVRKWLNTINKETASASNA
jgi:hypothetical protein